MKAARRREESGQSVIDLVLFGALGDLSLRKLYPALYQLEREGLLHDATRILGLARSALEPAAFVQRVEAALRTHIEPSELEQEALQRLLTRLDYLALDFTHAERYRRIAEWRQARWPVEQERPLPGSRLIIRRSGSTAIWSVASISPAQSTAQSTALACPAIWGRRGPIPQAKPKPSSP